MPKHWVSLPHLHSPPHATPRTPRLTALHWTSELCTFMAVPNYWNATKTQSLSNYLFIYLLDFHGNLHLQKKKNKHKKPNTWPHLDFMLLHWFSNTNYLPAPHISFPNSSFVKKGWFQCSSSSCTSKVSAKHKVTYCWTARGKKNPNLIPVS